MLRVLPPLIEPDVWTLAFHRTSKYWWVRWLALGKYKHVSAFAWVPALNLWVVYDITLLGTKVLLLPDSAAATAWLSARMADADLLQMPRRICKSYAPIIAPFFCVPAIRHLVGIPGGALRPTAFYAECRAQGAEPIHGQRPAAADDRPGDPALGAAGGG